jgi:hypothetical protein
MSRILAVFSSFAVALLLAGSPSWAQSGSVIPTWTEICPGKALTKSIAGQSYVFRLDYSISSAGQMQLTVAVPGQRETRFTLMEGQRSYVAAGGKSFRMSPQSGSGCFAMG